jgi:hypothetical protein
MSKYSLACSSGLVSSVNSNEPRKEYKISKNAFEECAYVTGIHLSTPISPFFTNSCKCV